jgi:hypothetical protein
MFRRKKESAGKSVFFLLLLVFGVLVFAALPDLQRYLRMNQM